MMPNPWDVGSARLLASCGFEALATTSAGLAWSLGKLDQAVSRDELVAHVSDLANATPLPLNVDSERCYPDDPGGVAETVALLAGAGASGCSIEDYDPVAGRIDDVEVAAERVAIAAEAAHGLRRPDGAHRPGREPHPRRRRPRRHDRAPARLPGRGADAVYAPGLHDLEQIAAVVEAVGVPVNVLALRTGRPSRSWHRWACVGSRPGARWPPRPTERCSRARASCSRTEPRRTPRAALPVRHSGPRSRRVPSVQSGLPSSCALKGSAAKHASSRPTRCRGRDARRRHDLEPAHPGRAPRERAGGRAARATRT